MTTEKKTADSDERTPKNTHEVHFRDGDPELTALPHYESPFDSLVQPINCRELEASVRDRMRLNIENLVLKERTTHKKLAMGLIDVSRGCNPSDLLHHVVLIDDLIKANRHQLTQIHTILETVNKLRKRFRIRIADLCLTHARWAHRERDIDTVRIALESMENTLEYAEASVDDLHAMKGIHFSGDDSAEGPQFSPKDEVALFKQFINSPEHFIGSGTRTKKLKRYEEIPAEIEGLREQVAALEEERESLAAELENRDYDALEALGSRHGVDMTKSTQRFSQRHSS